MKIVEMLWSKDIINFRGILRQYHFIGLLFCNITLLDKNIQNHIFVLINSGDAAIFNTNNNLPPLLLHKVSSEILNPLHAQL